MRENDSYPNCGIFGQIVELYQHDEKAYRDTVNNLKPEHLVEFLHHTFCTFPAANRFLVDALKLAQDHGWDT